MKVADLFSDQKMFSDLIGIPDSATVTDAERDELTKTLALALHTEVSNLVSATSYRAHTSEKVKPDSSKILFESVDVLRYAVAIMNLWGLNPADFQDAWRLKDRYLRMSRESELSSWKGEEVAIVDIDDVLCEFRSCFAQWLSGTYGINADVESSEYYFINDLKAAGINPEGVFEKFIEDGGFRDIPKVEGAVELIGSLKSNGYYVHLLTARPGDNLRCVYDTYAWLESNEVKFDKLSFASEKLRWCMQSEYWVKNSIAFAIDDSPKHAAEYAKHGVKVLLPDKPYNKEVQHTSGVTVYSLPREISSKLKL